MRRIRAIHPSATLFAGILLAFTLPFGYSTASCGPSTSAYRGVDLLRAHVEPEYGDIATAESREYAESVASNGVAFGWLLFGSALIGLALAVFAGGRLWATCCAFAASLALVLAIAIDLAESYIGWELAFFLPASGVAAKVFLAIGRFVHRRVRPFAAPHLPRTPERTSA